MAANVRLLCRSHANIFPMPFETLAQFFVAGFVGRTVSEQHYIDARKRFTLMPETFSGNTTNSVSADSV